ncbi:MAG: hypothetical protein ACRDFB_08960, partial [Rhabdochlamydiaceae bacterium]
MVAAAGSGNYNFESKEYLPTISLPPKVSHIQADEMGIFIENSLENRAELLDQNSANSHQDIYLIDTYIQVKIPSLNFRQAKVGYWEAQHNSLKRWTWIEGGFGTFLAAGAIIAHATPPALATFAACSVGLFILSGINIYKTCQASHQIDGWKANPIEKIAKERAKAYQMGFLYVYQNNLKLQGSSHNQILLPQEVSFLFKQYSSQFYTTLLTWVVQSDQQKKDWIDLFKNYNPVSQKVLCYANNDVVPQKYQQISSDYEILYQQLCNVQNGFEKLRNESRSKT